MKAVFVNHCHPEMPHVCGLRLGRFASAMAGRGHRVVLICEAFPRGSACPDPAVLGDTLAGHDWAAPFVLPWPPMGHRRAAEARTGVLPAGWRHLVIGASFAFDNGMFGDWQAGAARYFPALVSDFGPDVVWSTFGNTDAWAIAQALAGRAKCPWVADFKDNWSAFLPAGFAGLMARRFGDAAQMTVLSEGHCDEADRWFNIRKTVLYSGVDAVSGGASPAPFRILLAGSVYDGRNLARLIGGIRRWLETGRASDVEFVYAGNDGDRVADAARPLDGLCRVIVHGFIGLPDLAALQSGAAVNVYVQNDRNIFHHKCLELMAAARPVIALPDESGETRRLAGEAGCSLFVCADPDQVVDALEVIESGTLPPPDPEALDAFTWARRAETLEAVLSAAVEGRR